MTPSRRAALTGAALLAASACAPVSGRRDHAPPAPRTDDAPVLDRDDDAARLARLERRFGARLGVYAFRPGSDAVLAHRADERFAFCSTFKALAVAAVLARAPLPQLERKVAITAEDLMASSSITRGRVATGMTLAELCDAAIRVSDGTAGNLLLREIGGPPGLTGYLRSLGDPSTRSDRPEPVLADAVPGDPRDTTTPRAFAANLGRVVLGDALPPPRRAFLRGLLERTATPPRIRAGVPPGHRVANKTGNGDYGTLNDVAVIEPPAAPPLAVALFSTRDTAGPDAEGEPELLTEATRIVVARFA